jgi:hypothetical protein
MKKSASFAVGFCTVLVAGVAAAQVGTIGRDAPAGSDKVATAQTEKPAAAKPLDLDKPLPLVTTQPKPVDKPVDKPVAPKPESDTTAPEIKVIEPANGAVFSEKSVTFRGVTESGSKVLAGTYQAEVDAEGNWAITLLLSPGENKTTFKAIDKAGNVGTASVVVVYDVEVDKPVMKEFSANQKYRQSAEPYEKFWGTGTPGTKIMATSEYGSGSTEVSEHGEWWLKVWFEAPLNVTFRVTISDSAGHSKVFEFTRTGVVEKEFWAEQKYGSCSENPAYDVFYGQGTPGMVVEIGSPYGSGRTVIGDGGSWDMKVFFETAPVGEAFEVVLETSGGHRTVFAFTRLGG